MSFTHLIGVAIVHDKRTDQNEQTFNDDYEGQTIVSTRIQTKRTCFTTIMCCGCFFSFGTTMAIIGPTLIELGHLVNHGLNMMSWLFFTQAAYALLGAVMSGIILDRYVDKGQ